MSIQKVYENAMRGYQAAIAEETAAFQRAQFNGDIDEQVRASQAIAGLRASVKEYNALAMEQVQPAVAGAARNRYGLTQEEVEIAHKAHGQIRVRGEYVDLSPDDKEKVYAEQKAKLHRLRASGEYRQTTEQTG